MANNRARIRAALIAGVLLAAVQSAPAFAKADTPVTVTCGEYISSSITLANDLTCSGTALSVNEDGVTVNLNGHVISGDGHGAAIVLAPDPNNQSEVTISNVTITNGTIQNFADAAFFEQTINPTLSRLTLVNDAADNSPVLDTLPGGMTHGLVLTHSSVLDTNGLITDGSLEINSFTVSDSVITTGEFYFSQTVGGPTFTDDHFTDVTLDLDIEGGSTVTGSKFVDSRVIDNDGGFGYDTFQNNTFTGTAGTALIIANVYGPEQILGNTFSGNDVGLSVSGSLGDAVSGNTFTNNATAGVYFNDTTGAPPGTGSQPGAQLTVSNNTATGNGKHPDGALDPDNVPIEGGIYLYLPTGGATITGNTTTHNGGYGIYALPSIGGIYFNATSGNISTGDYGKCYPLGICTYN